MDCKSIFLLFLLIFWITDFAQTNREANLLLLLESKVFLMLRFNEYFWQPTYSPVQAVEVLC